MEGVFQDARVFAHAIAEAFHQAGEGVDAEGGLNQTGRLGRQMDGGQLIQAHGMVGYHGLGGRLGDPSPCVFQGFGHLGRIVFKVVSYLFATHLR